MFLHNSLSGTLLICGHNIQIIHTPTQILNMQSSFSFLVWFGRLSPNSHHAKANFQMECMMYVEENEQQRENASRLHCVYRAGIEINQKICLDILLKQDSMPWE